MSLANVHFTITIGGIGVSFMTLVGCAYRLGRILQRLDSHIDDSNEIHRKMDERIAWLERVRRR